MGVNIYDLEIAHSAEGDRGVLVLVVDAAATDRVRDALHAAAASAARSGGSARDGSFVAGRRRRGVHGRLRVPGDKSISHRALLLAARAEGRSRLRGLSTGDDVRPHPARPSAASAPTCRRRPAGEVVVDGGAGRLGEPDGLIDVGNSGTAIRLLAGWAAASTGSPCSPVTRRSPAGPWTGWPSPCGPMGAASTAARAAGCRRWSSGAAPCRASTTACPCRAPRSKGPSCSPASPPTGETTVREAVPTRAHTEELLRAVRRRHRRRGRER